MNTQTISLDFRQFLNRHTVEVFETMLSLKAAPLGTGTVPHLSEHVTGSVGFGGDNVTGAVYFHLTNAFATQVTGAMLGLTPQDGLGESEVNDVVGELTNMLAGGLKSALCDAGAPCAVSTPAIIRGAFEIECTHDVRRETLSFECGPERIFVELHIKLS